ncbi:peptidoglycan bridge formation protein FemAB [Bifidobacterium sp. DSM 109957]|uniref:Peptidoglycan bridge formation protein FemAB n=2 Tax=Bifidobacterium oedipodis TaxID=2675322 RepID=A0A7Y0ERP0_9BIFI|nr:aminoacyltransferase [Bifidobacterium sp. DSM 109957]NMM95167.1 peptidoglycan bridge formation protein FemAB [Bifidobacterium sp. DSM 109957]
MKAVPITPDELDELSLRHPQGGMQQCSQMQVLAAHRTEFSDIVGVKNDNGDIVAAALIEYTRGHFGIEGSIWFGPLCDFHDMAMLKIMTDGIRSAAASRGAISVTCWPNVEYLRHESDGAPNGEKDDATINNLTSLGWHHAGFGTGYGSVCNRWNYVKDLNGIADEKVLLHSYDKRTQWSVKRAQSMGVHVRELDQSEFPIFANIERNTAERRGFVARDEQYFHDFKDAFGAQARFMLAEIHIAEYVSQMTAKRDALTEKVRTLQAKYDEHPTTKTERQLGEETRNLEAANKRLDEATEFAKNGDVLPAAASLFVERPREMVYLFSGSLEKYKPFYASALIQHWAMSRCLEAGIPRYNFYGISGVFNDPDDEGRGVLEFKQGFNGYVEELVGEFTLPVNKLRFGIKEAASKLLHK